ncbi:hypothetical protein FRX31_027071 [Thalictrum thalictroides]|uniref:Uncharacterized protein n=1 Tax=Thalictrum thalictroides TaxID=46969 RepID=A0A7J6VF80_THATH|nr:hypothetical protein FRX31_027071 [Thalictrum thalictroides]
MSLSLLATSTIPSSSLVNPLRSNTKNHSTVRFGKGVAYTSCEQKQSKDEDSHTIDRRNVLLGLGGLYGASATIGSQGKIAMGAPVAPPDLSKCQLATDAANGEQVT